MPSSLANQREVASLSIVNGLPWVWLSWEGTSTSYQQDAWRRKLSLVYSSLAAGSPICVHHGGSPLPRPRLHWELTRARGGVFVDICLLLDLMQLALLELGGLPLVAEGDSGTEPMPCYEVWQQTAWLFRGSY